MTRIAVASDLHFDERGYLTAPALVREVAEAMSACGADAIILAGDIGHPLRNFRACLDMFAGRGLPVGVVVGNHDVWRDEVYGSRALFEEVLPTLVKERGCTWLERDTLLFGGTAVVGSMAWYDYSAAMSDLELSTNYFAEAKPRISNDALWIDWPWTDLEVAHMLRSHLLRRLGELESNLGVDRVVVVTHVPLFEQQLLRNPSNFEWSVANAYFGNLTTGQGVARFPKVRSVVSGHLHASIEDTVQRKGMAPLRVIVIGSDYGAPSWVIVEA
jgi:UDP-2,3-diacylglucosamine pyrophosphatase LpxH